jgi:hypothetical protein
MKLATPPKTCDYENCQARATVKVPKRWKGGGAFHMPRIYCFCAKHAKSYLAS